MALNFFKYFGPSLLYKFEKGYKMFFTEFEFQEKIIKIGHKEKRFNNKNEKINFLRCKLKDFFSKEPYNKNLIEKKEYKKIFFFFPH